MKKNGIDKYADYVKHYQLRAVEVICDYMASKSKKQCLIHIPTGAGKTGVMAVIASVSTKNVLIIVPSASLPQQTQTEITIGFWDSIQIPNKPNIKVELLNTVKKIEALNGYNNTVFISTVQFLEKHFNSSTNSKKIIKILSKNIDIVFFDEGHKEPATKWRKITRSLKKKTVLFTATPYRNDSKAFDIDKTYKYSYTLSEAIREGDVSNLKFIGFCDQSLRYGVLRARATCDDYELLNIVQENVENGKIVIRSETAGEIKHLTDFLNSSNIKTLGLHSEFQNTETTANNGYTAVSKQTDFQVFVSYDILTEGINIPSIKTIIFLNTFSNFRSTVQMIGRALRKSEKVVNANIYIPKCVLKEHEEQWNSLLDFKPSSENEDSYTYVNGLYKKIKNDKKLLDLKDITWVPLRASVSFSVNDLFYSLTETIKKSVDEDSFLEKLGEYSNDQTYAILYKETKYSSLLKTIALENHNFHLCVLTKVSSDKGFYYFYNNTNGSLLINSDNVEFANGNLKNFINLIDADSEIKSAKYEKTTPALSTGIISKDMYGRQLQNTHEALEHKLSFCRNLISKSKDNKIRYINPISSRISDTAALSLEGYLEWCKEIVDKLGDTAAKRNSIFNRFAKLVAPACKEPSYIYLLLRTDVFTDDNDYLDFFGADISTDLSFSITIADQSFEFKLQIDSKTKKYIILSKNESSTYDVKLKDDSDNPLNLIDIIKASELRLYFLEEQIVYVHGSYFSSNIKTTFTNPEQWSLWSRIEKIEELGQCQNEKCPNGEMSKIEEWPIESVFGVLKKKIIDDFPEINFLICDDMGTEIADFIGIDSNNNKIIYIHCKHSAKKLSASTFQDVCGQAVKNIKYIMSTSQDGNRYFANREEKWRVNWPKYSKNKGNEEDGGKINRYVISNGKDRDYIFGKYKEMISSHLTEYEVWLVHSGLSLSELKSELVKDTGQKEQTPQLIWLLQSTQDALAEARAQLKIFCSP